MDVVLCVLEGCENVNVTVLSNMTYIFCSFNDECMSGRVLADGGIVRPSAIGKDNLAEGFVCFLESVVEELPKSSGVICSLDFAPVVHPVLT